MRELSPNELRIELAGTAHVILDVREPWEFEVCQIPGSINIPLNEIPMRLSQLSTMLPIVAVCHHGMRSEYAVHFLLGQGFSEVANLTGGIDRWARELDPAMTRY